MKNKSETLTHESKLFQALSTHTISVSQEMLRRDIERYEEARGVETEWESVQNNLDNIVQVENLVTQGEVVATPADHAFLGGCHRGFKFRLLELATGPIAF